MISLIADCLILLFGVAYPAYESFKAIKYRDVNGYVRWMCYWVVYAIYSICEATVGRYLLFWLPFYDMFRCLIILWLVSPFTRGAQLFYKNVVHPELNRREVQIDAMCTSYSQALQQGASGLLRYAASTIFQSFLTLNTTLFYYIQSHSYQSNENRLQQSRLSSVTYVSNQPTISSDRDDQGFENDADFVHTAVFANHAEPVDPTGHVNNNQQRGTRPSSPNFEVGLEFTSPPRSSPTSSFASSPPKESRAREAAKPARVSQPPTSSQARPSALSSSKVTYPRTNFDRPSLQTRSPFTSTTTTQKKTTFGLGQSTKGSS